MGVDVFDIVAVILGVIFTIRKLDAQRREPSEFPHVNEDEFLRWRARETRVYSVGMIACFAKALGKIVIAVFLADSMPYDTLRLLGAVLDISWLVLVLWTLVRGYRLAKERVRLRIVLGGFMVSSDAAEASRELADALAELRAEEYEKAQYHLHQISLDADESQKAIALYWLGECFLRQGKITEARDAFQESVEVDPSLVEPQNALKKLGKEASA